MIDVSVIVPCYKSHNCIRNQIAKWDFLDDGLNKEIIYVDDACPFRSHEVIAEAWRERTEQIDKTIVTHDTNEGFGRACNTGASRATGQYLLFLNADVVPTTNWIRPMYDCFHDGVGMVGGIQLNRDGTIESCGSEWCWQTMSFMHVGRDVYRKRKLWTPFRAASMPPDLLRHREAEMVNAACVMIPKTLFDKIGGFDTRYKIGYWEDADMNMQIRACGYKIIYTPKSVVFHDVAHTGSADHEFVRDNKDLFVRRWVDTGVLPRYPTFPKFFYFKSSNHGEGEGDRPPSGQKVEPV